MNSFLTAEDRKKLIEWRRDFHSHPELAYTETRTSSIAADHLKQLGYDVRRGIANTGVIGLLNGSAQGKTLMLRADMDCLPLEETNEVPYKSQNKGLMHACGHDGHTAVLMAVAKQLMGHKQSLKGSVKLIFQPAEEGGNGAEKMVQEGALKNPDVDAALGLHVWTSLPVGKIALNRGALLAGVDEFEITVTGKGGHGAAPHQTVDPIVTAAHMITALQTVVSRNADPLTTAVVTVGAFHSGTVFNIIPDSAKFSGTVRYFDPQLGSELPQWIARIVN